MKALDEETDFQLDKILSNAFENIHGKQDNDHSHFVFCLYFQNIGKSFGNVLGIFSSRAGEWAYDGICTAILNFRLKYRER